MVLWFAILSSKVSLEDDPDSSYAAKLVKRGSSADAVNPLTGKEETGYKKSLNNIICSTFLHE